MRREKMVDEGKRRRVGLSGSGADGEIDGRTEVER